MQDSDVSKRAVVIGINEYRDTRLATLQGAENDAAEIRYQLMTFGGFDIPDSAFLTGKQATSSAIREAISDLLYGTDEQTISLCYFSGHGFADAFGEGYLASYDIECARPWVNGIRMTDVRQRLLKAKNKKACILLLDCCYSGIVAEGDKAAEESADIGEHLDGPKETSTGAGRIIFASSGKDQKSREKLDCVHQVQGGNPHCHGLFTYNLIEGLDGGATHDAERGAVNLAALVTYVQAKMDRNTGPRLYAGSLQNAEEISILRSSRVSSQKGRLEQVRDGLPTADGPLELWDLCQTLAVVLDMAPGHPEASELRAALEAKIVPLRVRLVQFLDDNTGELVFLKGMPGGLRDRKQLARSLSFMSLAGPDYKKRLSDLDYLYQADRGEMTLKDYCETLKSRSSLQNAPPPAIRPPLVQGVPPRVDTP
jgi:uncharacterized caspase-like protein